MHHRIDASISTRIYGYSDIRIFGCSDVRVYEYTGTRIFGCTGSQVYVVWMHGGDGGIGVRGCGGIRCITE